MPANARELNTMRVLTRCGLFLALELAAEHAAEQNRAQRLHYKLNEGIRGGRQLIRSDGRSPEQRFGCRLAENPPAKAASTWAANAAEGQPKPP